MNDGVEPADPVDEERIVALHRSGLLDQPSRPDLEAITRLATYVTGAQAAAIHLIDRDRRWTVAATGMARVEVPRDQAMCDRVVAEGRAIHVADASADERFAANPFVDGRLGDVRMYAATPLRDLAGHLIGALCVTDTLVGELDRHQLAALEDLGHQVEHLIELHGQRHRVSGRLAQLDRQGAANAAHA